MSKKWIKKYLPDPDKVTNSRGLRLFGKLLENPHLFHLNRRSASKAAAIGCFFAFIPVPFQMVLAAGAAIWLRANLILSVALVWISNPLTIPPLFYFAYKVGTWILALPPREFTFQLSGGWLMHQLGMIWQPLLVGSLVCACISSFIGFIVMRFIWRMNVKRAWRNRSIK